MAELTYAELTQGWFSVYLTRTDLRHWKVYAPHKIDKRIHIQA